MVSGRVPGKAGETIGMIKEINKDPDFLSQKAEVATSEDAWVADDLLDTLKSMKDRCVGLAANMIGVNKAIIVFVSNGFYVEMFNPEIEDRTGLYETEEGCLSHDETHRTSRYQKIKVRWQDREMKKHSKRYTGWTAQIIQHELDHLNGVLI